ncbi:DNA-binding response regulator [Rubrivivax gelatinosus]|uniref:LytR/AlgR family response regulator transcription factor n=1 Tax=Rubrivivax gelatinosus TaxID=28068 RepID=UPI0019033DF8|nr:LytTR family DNA-binding domain-containing protein [Rubrivivax gelatinosus]MBK1616040.1 DNA-binding response regulator [Rubrivivax gelatinosus]
MTNPDTPLALIAEDEPVLARSLQRLLAQTWPGLRLAGVAEDGLAATAQALALLPDILFLDIRMPGRSGLDVAEMVADDWPEDRPTPLLVFVTAFDEFAVAAFERAAVDYVLKPVTPERLHKTVARLRERLAARAPVALAGDAAEQLRTVQAIQAPPATGDERIKVIRAGVGNTVRMIPVAEVVCLEATDKYVNVVTADGEALVRMSLRELAARIVGAEFTQVHRSVYVATGRIRSATRDELGHYSLAVDGLARPLKVSRAFAHLFRPM